LAPAKPQQSDDRGEYRERHQAGGDCARCHQQLDCDQDADEGGDHDSKPATHGRTLRPVDSVTMLGEILIIVVIAVLAAVAALLKAAEVRAATGSEPHPESAQRDGPVDGDSPSAEPPMPPTR
jgi:hypothetical protein